MTEPVIVDPLDPRRCSKECRYLNDKTGYCSRYPEASASIDREPHVARVLWERYNGGPGIFHRLKPCIAEVGESHYAVARTEYTLLVAEAEERILKALANLHADITEVVNRLYWAVTNPEDPAKK